MSTGGVVGLVVAGTIAVFALLIGAIALLGTDADSESDVSSGVEPAVVPDDFATIEGDGVSIAAPSSWDEVDPDSIDTGVLADAFPDASDELVEAGADAARQGLVLVATDSDPSGFAGNANIVRMPFQATLAELNGYAEAQLEPLGAELVSIDRAHLPVGDAVRVSYTLPVALPDGTSVPVHGVQHYVPQDGRTYIITVSTTDDTSDLADQVAATFRVS
jgi:hypothetical protein